MVGDFRWLQVKKTTFSLGILQGHVLSQSGAQV